MFFGEECYALAHRIGDLQLNRRGYKPMDKVGKIRKALAGRGRGGGTLMFILVVIWALLDKFTGVLEVFFFEKTTQNFDAYLF